MNSIKDHGPLMEMSRSGHTKQPSINKTQDYQHIFTTTSTPSTKQLDTSNRWSG